jgi:glutathione S-transferase
MSDSMALYTCGGGENGAPMHPCGRAAKALRDAGHSYELRKVPGFKLLPWTRMGGARDEIKQLSGQTDVPILVLSDGDVISGTGSIVRWAKEHPAA